MCVVVKQRRNENRSLEFHTDVLDRLEVFSSNDDLSAAADKTSKLRMTIEGENDRIRSDAERFLGDEFRLTIEIQSDRLFFVRNQRDERRRFTLDLVVGDGQDLT